MGGFQIGNPTIGGGTAYQDLLATLLGQLGQGQENRAGAAQNYLTYLQGNRQFGATLGTTGLDELFRRQQFSASTQQELLSSLQGQQAQSGNMATNLLGQLQSGRLGTGALGADLYGQLGAERAGRGGMAQGLFDTLLGAELAARQRPINFVDQLALSQQYGSVLPFSQTPSANLSQYGIQPGTLTADVQRRLMEFLEPDPFMQRVAQSTYGQMQMGYGEREATQTAQQATQPTSQMTGLASSILKGLAPTQQQNDMLKQTMAYQYPGAQEQATGSLINTFSQGAIPQARVRNVYNDPSGIKAFVELPNGTYDIVSVPQGQSGYATVQTSHGPASLPLGEVQSFLQRQRDTFAQQIEPMQGPERESAMKYILEVGNQTRRSQEAIVNQFRGANPQQRQDLINFTGAQ